ncbi:MAG: hypothetical protein H7A25_02555 [Leptospiraceae bacterium]|nr:hypothetical protein [Leptospiraceae bacterium]
MKRKKLFLLCTIFLTLFITNCSSIDVAVSSNKGRVASMKKIAILPFESEDAKLEKDFTDALVLNFMQTGKVEILERDRQYIDKILQEQKFARSGLIDQQTAAEMGKFLGVDAVVLGRIKPLSLAPEPASTENKKKEEESKEPRVVAGKLDSFLLKIINVESGTILINAMKKEGIEWSFPLILKRVFGFGYFWTTRDIQLESSDINYLADRVVNKIDSEMNKILKEQSGK